MKKNAPHVSNGAIGTEHKTNNNHSQQQIQHQQPRQQQNKQQQQKRQRKRPPKKRNGAGNRRSNDGNQQQTTTTNNETTTTGMCDNEIHGINGTLTTNNDTINATDDITGRTPQTHMHTTKRGGGTVGWMECDDGTNDDGMECDGGGALNVVLLEAEEDRSEDFQESFERASADLEMICAAYPNEVSVFQTTTTTTTVGSSKEDDEDDLASIPFWFPLIFTLALPSLSNNSNNSNTTNSANITMELPKGYPTTTTLQIVSYRGVPPSSSANTKIYVEAAVNAARSAAKEALDGGEECALACVAAAFDSWRVSSEVFGRGLVALDGGVCGEGACNMTAGDGNLDNTNDDDGDIHWITSDNTLVDRKSVFQAHVCPVSSEDMVRRAVDYLIRGSNKLQRASHNMFAYRFKEKLPSGKEILKHDNDDDGEDNAGSRLAQLLEMRKEDGVLVMVSRWYGGTHLGPKRFAHIVNVARVLLVECHEMGGCLCD